MSPTLVLVAVSTTVVVVIGVLVALGVKFLERQSDREAAATRLQLDIGEALGRDPELRPVSILPVVTVNWRGGLTVELNGSAATPELRDAALRAVERETGRLKRQPRLVSRIGVVAPGPPVTRRTA
jgi:hypothetical protein